VQAWFARHDFEDALAVMEAHDVPVGPVNTVAEVSADDQLRGRESLVEVAAEGVGPVLMPGLIPKFSRTPGAISHAGPELGQHSAAVLEELLERSRG